MSEFGEGKPFSRRTLLKKGASLAIGAVVGAEAVRRGTPAVTEAVTPYIENDPSKHSPELSHLYLGTMHIDTTEKIDPDTGEDDHLRFRDAPYKQKSELKDNRELVQVSTEIPFGKINSINGTDVKGLTEFSLKDARLVEGQNVDPYDTDGNGNLWVEIDAVVNDGPIQRDDHKKLYFNVSSQTALFVTLQPADQEVSGFVKATEIGDTLRVLARGSDLEPYLNPTNVVITPEATAQQ